MHIQLAALTIKHETKDGKENHKNRNSTTAYYVARFSPLGEKR